MSVAQSGSCRGRLSSPTCGPAPCLAARAREHLEPDVRGAFVHAPPSSQPVHDQQSAARRRVGSGRAQLVLEAAPVVDDLAPQVSGLELQPQSDRALPVHDGIRHQLADNQGERVQNVMMQRAVQPPA